MNDRRTVARPARAERSKLSTLSAPASSLRIARMADVSRTRRFGSGISAASPSPVVEQSTYGAALSRAAEGRDRIVRNGDDSYGISFDLPFEGRVRRDAELAPNRRRDGHLAARRDLRTHGREYIMSTLGMPWSTPRLACPRALVRRKGGRGPARRRLTSDEAPSGPNSVPNRSDL